MKVFLESIELIEKVLDSHNKFYFLAGKLLAI